MFEDSNANIGTLAILSHCFEKSAIAWLLPDMNRLIALSLRIRKRNQTLASHSPIVGIKLDFQILAINTNVADCQCARRTHC